MANKKIFDLPASGALVDTSLLETQLTANGQSQKATIAQVLAFIQANAIAFAQSLTLAQNLNVAGATNVSGLNSSSDITLAIGFGPVVSSPDGTQWRLLVSNAGVVSAVSI